MQKYFKRAKVLALRFNQTLLLISPNFKHDYYKTLLLGNLKYSFIFYQTLLLKNNRFSPSFLSDSDTQKFSNIQLDSIRHYC